MKGTRAFSNYRLQPLLVGVALRRGCGAARSRAQSLLVVVTPQPPLSGLTSSRVEETELRSVPAPTANTHTKTHTLLNLSPTPALGCPGDSPDEQVMH